MGVHGWRDHYLSAIRESDPEKLPQRLVTAEKAILLRIEVLHDTPDNLPELQALREGTQFLVCSRTDQEPWTAAG